MSSRFPIFRLIDSFCRSIYAIEDIVMEIFAAGARLAGLISEPEAITPLTTSFLA